MSTTDGTDDMDFLEIKQNFRQLVETFTDLAKHIDMNQLQAKLEQYAEMMQKDDFWQNQREAKKIIDQNNQVKDKIEKLSAIKQMIADIEVGIELYLEAEDGALLKEIDQMVTTLDQMVNQFELELLLSGPYDRYNAILEIHPGAGGTESQDWGEMLLRMYMRYADQSGYRVEILDYLAGDEAGIKSVTLLIKGENAYGNLKAEKGVHRLIRISPFDASGRRHTSFASVNVMPDIDDEIEVEIKPEDLRIDTYRSSGAGGQHVNTTDSAIRITHIPTGIVVNCQSERSQIKNREQALKMLRAKLYQKQLEEQQEHLEQIRGEQKEIGWGSQIRSYVFHPYSLVKDHRTNAETGNVQAVMDGGINYFIKEYLRSIIQY